MRMAEGADIAAEGSDGVQMDELPRGRTEKGVKAEMKAIVGTVRERGGEDGLEVVGGDEKAGGEMETDGRAGKEKFVIK